MQVPPTRHWIVAALQTACVVVFLCQAPISLLAVSHAEARAAADAAAEQGKKEKAADDAFPLVDDNSLLSVNEIKHAAVRLPLAAVLGAVLALRPRRRAQGRRSVLVVQTQIMLAIVGAVIMLVVGDSVSRAFGIVGAAGLVRYRSTIDDPKEAVVMLCALAAGLAAGVGLYRLAPFATLFMTVALFIVEWFEPTARKYFELSIRTRAAADFRPQVEGVLKGFALEFELLVEKDEEIGYSVSAPIDVRTRDISDMLRVLHSADEDMSIEWDEKRARK
jgi:uncharacterized membrane protein YhiD involved in acid resistance